VYSAGMLLSLLGYPTDRSKTRSLFGLSRNRRGYEGTDLGLLANVVRKIAGLQAVRWRFHARFVFAEIAQGLQRQFEATGLPTLMWFGSVYSDRSTRAHHIAVALEAKRSRILLLDPLGQAPAGGNQSNVSILAAPRESGFFPAKGSFYYVDPRMEAGILCWQGPAGGAQPKQPLGIVGGLSL
jgi:hypothetical protein